MKNFGYLILIALVAVVASCSKPMAHYDKEISQAEKLMESNPDSALAILQSIDFAELTVDSIRAKYYYALAFARDRQDNVALADSMISFSNDFYRGKDLKRSIRSATLLASYKFHIGEKVTALRMLDSLSLLDNVPDTLLIEPLRNRIMLFAYEGHHEALIRRLMSIDKDDAWQSKYKLWLYFALVYDGMPNLALEVIDSLIENVSKDDADIRLRYKYEKIAALMDMGKYQESLNLIDSLLEENTDKTGDPYFHLWKSLGLLNMRKYNDAVAQLAIADSLASDYLTDSQNYYNSFSTVLHTVLNYDKTGKVSLIPFARVNNPQRDNLLEEKNMRQEAAGQALEAENQRLIIKAKSDRQTALLIIIVLLALLVSGALIWYAFNKKRKALEVLERNEILQKLVDESKSTQADASVNDKLRRAMLQQLGIIKMVAETPTEQNREMLRKISSVENGKDGSIVNWENVYDIIDNLYSGFYSRLHNRHGNVLSGKEEQIIALMVAGFSTKEISVITAQTAATIYVRKSSIRKKLGVPEKEDIVAFLRQETDD